MGCFGWGLVEGGCFGGWVGGATRGSSSDDEIGGIPGRDKAGIMCGGTGGIMTPGRVGRTGVGLCAHELGVILQLFLDRVSEHVGLEIRVSVTSDGKFH